MTKKYHLRGTKVLLVVAAVALGAAACNKTSTTPTNSGVGQTSPASNSTSKADAALVHLNSSVDTEQSISTKSDSDVVNSDKTVINNYDGATNANY